MSPKLRRIVGYLNATKIRATYGAVGELLGVPGRAVGAMLGRRRPEVSWVVNARTGKPTGYSAKQCHPDLYKNPYIIRTGEELRSRMEGEWSEDDGLVDISDVHTLLDLSAEMESGWFVGVDGCRLGWVYISISRDRKWRAGVVPSIERVVVDNPNAQLILVDIPIGLRDDGSDERRCDREARTLLRQRRSSVFPAPCRPAVYQSNYESASNLNERLTGRRLTKQSWAISPKIREVDAYMTGHSDGEREKIREIHPEICFWALNDRNPMEFAKKKPEGYQERKNLLSRLLPETSAIECSLLDKYSRAQVAIDDVMDAMVGAYTAYNYSSGLRTVPAMPQRDSYGLPMEMVYFAGQ